MRAQFIPKQWGLSYTRLPNTNILMGLGVNRILVFGPFAFGFKR